ncbi:MAG: glutathione peroxidase [Pseudomonadota bacterium]
MRLSAQARVLAKGVFAPALAVAAIIAGLTAVPAKAETLNWAAKPLTGLEGEAVDGKAFAGRVVLLVNTASQCAFTPQYEALEALWQRYRDTGFTVLGVPSNDFGGQEPGSNEEIAAFCSSTYGVSFPMLQKAPVTGPSAHPLFAWARQEGGRAAVPAWNFHKVLIGRDGEIAGAFPSYIKPDAPQVTAAIERALRTPAL